MQIPRHVGQARVFSFVPHQMKMLFAELAVFLALDGLVLRDPLTYICSVNENAHDSVSERLRRWTRNPLGSARKGLNPVRFRAVKIELLDLMPLEWPALSTF